MNKDESKNETGTAALVVMTVALPWMAYVGKTLWWWFAVPLGAPAAGTWQAIGLMTIAAWWRSKPEKTTVTVKDVASVAVMHVGFLGIGALAHWLMTR